MCSDNEVRLQVPPGTKIEYWRIPDPHRPDEEWNLVRYHQARQQIKDNVFKLIEE
ncbi:MAG: hypothetical protein HW399_91 [Dehalococcoidia bacterium]|nr:hypothetical protein [Dehalococcoidia bacterium]